MSISPKDILNNYNDLSVILEVNFGVTDFELIDTTNQKFAYKLNQKAPLKVIGTSIVHGTLKTSSVVQVGFKEDTLEVITLNSVYTFKVLNKASKTECSCFIWEPCKDILEALNIFVLSSFLDC